MVTHSAGTQQQQPESAPTQGDGELPTSPQSPGILHVSPGTQCESRHRSSHNECFKNATSVQSTSTDVHQRLQVVQTGLHHSHCRLVLRTRPSAVGACLTLLARNGYQMCSGQAHSVGAYGQVKTVTCFARYTHFL